MKQPERKKAVIPENNDPLNLPNQSSNKYTQFTEKEALKTLYSLIEADNARKHPNNPYPLRAKPYNLKKTGDLTKAVIHFLRLKHCQAERVTSSGRYVDNSIISTNIIGQRVKIGSGRWIPGTSTNGTADISSTIRGMSVKWEVKNGKTFDRQSEAQKRYQAEVEKSGGKYYTVKSFAHFMEIYYSTWED